MVFSKEKISGIINVLPPRYWQQKGGMIVFDWITFLLSVMASVIAHYIYKWLDGEE